jgi:hypothetical protein
MRSLPALRSGADTFLAHHAHHAEWQVQFCAIAPQMPPSIQAELQAASVIAQPLQKLLSLLATPPHKAWTANGCHFDVY